MSLSAHEEKSSTALWIEFSAASQNGVATNVLARDWSGDEEEHVKRVSEVMKRIDSSKESLIKAEELIVYVYNIGEDTWTEKMESFQDRLAESYGEYCSWEMLGRGFGYQFLGNSESSYHASLPPEELRVFSAIIDEILAAQPVEQDATSKNDSRAG